MPWYEISTTEQWTHKCYYQIEADSLEDAKEMVMHGSVEPMMSPVHDRPMRVSFGEVKEMPENVEA